MEEVDGGDVEDLGLAHEDDAGVEGAPWVGEIDRHNGNLGMDFHKVRCSIRVEMKLEMMMSDVESNWSSRAVAL